MAEKQILFFTFFVANRKKLCYTVDNKNGGGIFMYCPKCGADNKDTQDFCENCGYSFAKEPEPETFLFNEPVVVSKEIISEVKLRPVIKQKSAAKPSPEKIGAYCLWGVAILVLMLSVIGAICIFYGGSEIADIRTVGGNTIEEVYLRRIQPVYNGFGFLALALGAFLSSLLAFFGFQTYRNDQKTTDCPKETKQPLEEDTCQPIV